MDRYDVFNRTDDERQRAFEHIVARATAGRNGDLLELSVCADCGQYGVWDSDLHHPLDERPTGSVCCHPSGRHLVARVALRPIPPGER